MAEETVLRVELDGISYTLRGAASEKRLRQTADLVAQKIEAVRRLCPQYSSSRATMLAALQIAEEFLAMQDEYLEMLEVADIGAQTDT